MLLTSQSWVIIERMIVSLVVTEDSPGKVTFELRAKEWSGISETEELGSETEELGSSLLGQFYSKRGRMGQSCELRRSLTTWGIKREVVWLEAGSAKSENRRLQRDELQTWGETRSSRACEGFCNGPPKQWETASGRGDTFRFTFWRDHSGHSVDNGLVGWRFIRYGREAADTHKRASEDVKTRRNCK